MDTLIQYITELYAIWAPSLTAVIGIVVMAITAVYKTKTLVDKVKSDTTMQELREDLKKCLKDNAELKQQNALLLDQITKIKDYAKNKKGV